MHLCEHRIKQFLRQVNWGFCARARLVCLFGGRGSG
jgi:hypothetical protein